MRQIETWRATGVADDFKFFAASATAAPAQTESVDALLELFNASARAAYAIDYSGSPDRPARLSLGAASDTGSGESLVEDVYVLSGGAGHGMLRVERVCRITWQGSAVPETVIEEGMFAAAAAVVTDDARLEARVGAAPQGVAETPASVEIFDLGPVQAVVRVARTISGDPWAPTHRRWE